MKKLILLILAVFVATSFSGSISAQSLSAKGIKVGLNLSDISGRNVSTVTHPVAGVSAGGFLTFRFNTQFAIQPEFFYSMKGYRVEDVEPGVDITSTVALNYFEFPVLGVYSIQDRISLFAGPALAVYLNGETVIRTEGELGGVPTDETETVKFDSADIEGLEFDWVFGGSYSVGNISFEARYTKGLTTFAEVPDGVASIDVKNKVIQFMLGLSF